ncbi:MAG: phytanoyl-CoA dioxygenase family protein [Acidimicrobiales bacterium]|jgi:hypothetical protein|nr:phytanoyl-CoA dioxygenase family protein [Acidimicrobiales bacterium]
MASPTAPPSELPDAATLDSWTVEEVLAAADALVVAGRGPEAVALLTERNRRRPDGTVERRLVGVRHAAFAAVADQPGRATWPPEVPDLFAGVHGLPEVPAAELSADTVAAGIVHHGALLVRGLLAPPVVDSLIADIDRAFEAMEARISGVPLEQTIPWFAGFKPGPDYELTIVERSWVRAAGGMWAVDSPRALFHLLEAFEQVGLREVLTGYLGERPALSVKKCTLRKVPVDTNTDWHQDGAFLGQGIRTVNVWITLSPCGVDAPGLDVVPRRLDDIVETGTSGAAFDWSVGESVVADVAAPAGVVRPVFGPGDALLFDDLNLHRTGISPGMTEERYAVESWFFAPSSYPHAQVPILF